MFWLVEHAGELLTEYSAGHDGRAPFGHLFGKQCREAGYEFGELAHYCARPTESARSLGALWESGIWLGRRRGTGARIVAVSSREAREVRAVARRP
eukprot:11741168-Alexandrium_andersonii.AAC.1